MCDTFSCDMSADIPCLSLCEMYTSRASSTASLAPGAVAADWFQIGSSGVFGGLRVNRWWWWGSYSWQGLVRILRARPVRMCVYVCLAPGVCWQDVCWQHSHLTPLQLVPSGYPSHTPPHHPPTPIFLHNLPFLLFRGGDLGAFLPTFHLLLILISSSIVWAYHISHHL